MLGPPLGGGPSPAAQHVPHPASSARVLTHPRARNSHRPAAHAHLPARSHPRARPSSWPRQAARQAHSGPMHSGSLQRGTRARTRGPPPVTGARMHAPSRISSCALASCSARIFMRTRIRTRAHPRAQPSRQGPGARRHRRADGQARRRRARRQRARCRRARCRRARRRRARCRRARCRRARYRRARRRWRVSQAEKVPASVVPPSAVRRWKPGRARAVCERSTHVSA